MSVDIRSSDKRRYIHELQAREKEIEAGLLKTSQPSSPKAVQENEKRIRREIANSNERRRMQCINAGFSSLRALIPQLEGEKLSKAAILQHATEYISALEKEKSRLQLQLEQTKGLLSGLSPAGLVTDGHCVSSSPPPSKRKKRDTESSDEGVSSLSDASDDSGSELQQENVALRNELDLERQRYAMLEQHNRLLETQFLTWVHAGQAPHAGPVNELRPLDVDHHHIQQSESVYVRDLMAPRELHAAQFDGFPISHSLPARERRTPVDVDPVDATTHRPASIDSTASAEQLTPSPMPTAEVPVRSPVVRTTSSLTVPVPTTTTPPAATEDSSYHLDNYCHRDHPRRRHRQLAQVEQQKQETQLRQQQQQALNDPFVYHGKHNTQNLEKLVEAIRQIEGDRIKFNEDEYKLCDQLPTPAAAAEESEREVSSDQDEPKSESSGRDSPLHHHHHHHHNSSQQQQQTHMSMYSHMSEKYPIATTLLHHPLNPSYYRPGVIVHKH